MTDDALPPDDSQPIIPGDDARRESAEILRGYPEFPDLSDVSLRMDEIEHELNEALLGVTEAIASVIADVTGTLDAGDLDIGTAVADVTGGIDTSLTSAESPVWSVIDRTGVGIDKTLFDAYEGLYNNNIQIPTDLSTISDHLTQPIENWVPGILMGDQVLGGIGPKTESTGGTTITSLPDTVGSTTGGDILVTDPTNTGTSHLPLPPPLPPPPASPPTSPPPPPNTSCESSCPAPVITVAAPACPVPPVITTNTTVTQGDITVTTSSTATANTGGGMPEQGSGTPVPPPTTPPTTPPPPPPPPPPKVPPPPAAPPLRIIPPLSADGECMDWDVADVCKVAGAGRAGAGILSGGTGGERPAEEAAWTDPFLTQKAGDLSLGIPGFVAATIGRETAAVFSSPSQYAAEHTIASQAYTGIVESLTAGCVRNKGLVTQLTAKLAAIHMVEAVLHAPVSYLAQGMVYHYQSLNPQHLPDQSGIDALYIRGYIDIDTWRCLTKAHGNLPGWHQSAMMTKQALLTPDELTRLHLRDRLNGQALIDRFREVGFLNPGYVSDILTLADQPLGASDIIRCMVRDSFDPKVVKKYEYDKDFPEKFSGQAKDWFKWQGFSEQQAKYLWYAHWNIPSNTQLYEMLHRLRPDRKEVVEHGRQIALHTAAGLDPPDEDPPPVVTVDDVREALEINDVAPAWVDRLIAISYHPITNTDAMRMYMIGYIDKPELVDKFKDNGYTQADSENLADFYEYETNKRIRTQSGVLTPSKVVSYYRVGAFTRADASDALKDLFPNTTHVDTILDNAERDQQAESKSIVVRGLKRDYVTGKWSDDDVTASLQAAGIDPRAAGILLKNWSNERLMRSKEVNAAQLCKWADRGLISTAEHIDRLQRLGYSEKDARNIARVCEMDSAYKRNRRKRQEAKEALADAKATGSATLSKMYKEIEAAKKLLDELKAAGLITGGNNGG